MLRLWNITELYKLKNQNRYTQGFKIYTENVAEHSYYVVLFTDFICNAINADNELRIKCLRYAMIHDIPEMYTSDVPRPMKVRNHDLVDVLLKEEYNFMDNCLPQYSELYKECSSRDTNYKVNLVVETADILSVMQYAMVEEKLGNTDIYRLRENAMDRLDKNISKLSKTFDILDIDLFKGVDMLSMTRKNENLRYIK